MSTRTRVRVKLGVFAGHLGWAVPGFHPDKFTVTIDSRGPAAAALDYHKRDLQIIKDTDR